MTPWHLALPESPSPAVQRITALLQRQVAARCGVALPLSGDAQHRLALAVAPGPGPEGFHLEEDPEGGLLLTGHDERGLLYGVGKLLRDASCGPGSFVPGSWRGQSRPDKPLRGIYFATHFHNWYHEAPVEEIERYVEELALWGYNTVCVWFDMHHYHGIADPAAQAMLARLIAILNAARRIGLNTSTLFLANEAYANSPVHLRADWTAGHNGYHHEIGSYRVELCPSKPGATELILQWAEEKLAAFAPVGLDYLWIWPYDQGGCTCSACAPWGANGYLRLAEPVARLFRRACPNGRVILSTWYFGHFTDGEWAGLARAFEPPPDWVDVILADDYGDLFPAFPLEHGVPGGLPLINFPEISMYRCSPWGGYGANPFPRHLQALWDQSGHLLSGGFPYSEGIYEDMNKAVVAQLYWDANKSAMATVREYLAYESSPQVVEPLTEAIAILEQTLPRGYPEQTERGVRFTLPHTEGAERCWQLVEAADALLPPDRRMAWRWRLLYLRARIDRELAAHDGFSTPLCERAFEELSRIYHAEGVAASWVAPPTHEALAARRSALAS